MEKPSSIPDGEPPVEGGKWHWFDWLDTIPAGPLRRFEVMFTVSYLIWLGNRVMTWREWLTEDGFHLSASELQAMGYPSPFPLPAVPVAALLAFLVVSAAVGVTLNRFRRVSLAVLFGCALYQQGVDFMSAFTLNKLFVGVFGVLTVCPGYTKNSTSSLMVCALPVRVLQVTLVLQYLAAGLAKATYGDWLIHTDVLFSQVQGVYRTDFAAWMLCHTPLPAWAVLQWITLGFELQAPVLFAIPRLRIVAYAIGLGFHVVIALMMKDLIFFSLQMFSFYALFMRRQDFTWFLPGKLRRAPP